jgi:hypothetical protein
MTFLKHAFITLLLLWAAIALLGRQIDSVCMEGQLSTVQADAINSRPWKKCPSYRHGVCRVEEEDRVVVRECADFSRKFLFRRLIPQIVFDPAARRP